MAGLNSFVGWGLSTLALYFLNKNSNSASESNWDPETLNVNSNQTKIGSPIPVVLGRCLIKSPLVIYFGDFRAERYTETYAAHAKFNAWPLVFALIAQYIAAAISGHQVSPGKVTSQGTGYHGVQVHSSGVSSGATFKDDLVGPLINSLFMWLLSWLINGRNLKTTLQKGFKYYLGYQQLVCWSGENMRIRAIYMKEKKVWEGDEPGSHHVGAPFIVKVNDAELFGGPDEGGGFIGELRIYLGGRGQSPDPWMQKEMLRPTVQEELRGLTPAYRLFVNIVTPTAYIGKSATIPETWIELQNCPDRLGLGQIGEDANPAEVLYELHVNNAWGLAENADALDVEALKKIGETLKKEGTGISVLLTSKTQAQTLINSICEHINAIKYSDPATGKLTYKLIRDDYDVTDLKHLDVHNCSNVSFSRPSWSDTVSEISVAYTDRAANYEQSTIPAVDPANVEMNGGIRTTKTYSYTYFTNAENAMWAAKRELYQQGYPLAAVSAEGNRQLSNLRIGEVVVLDWQPYGVKNMLLRITNVDTGDFVGGTVKIDAIEDVFSLTKSEYGFSGSTEWRPPDVYPTGVQVFRYLEMPWELSQSKDTFVSAFAVEPDDDTQIWTVWRKRKDGNHFESTSSMTNWTAAGRLVYDYDEFTDAEDALGFEIAEFEGIGKLDAGDEDFTNARRGGRVLAVDDEIMAYSALRQLPNGHWYVKGIIRGVYDTVPAQHFAQSKVFFIRSGFYANVTTGGPVCAAGETVIEDYNITTATTAHTEDLDFSKTETVITSRRAERPSVPGRVRISAHALHEKTNPEAITGDLTVSWIPRDKASSFGCVSQDDAIEYWSQQPFSAPDGSRCMVKIIVGDAMKEYRTANNTQTSLTYTWAQRCSDFPDVFANADTKLELYAEHNGLLSYQAQRRAFQWRVPALADCAQTEAIAAGRLSAWGMQDRIAVPAGAIAADFQLLYTEMPIILLGAVAGTQQSDALLSQDGTWFVPNGQFLAAAASGQYDLRTMGAGFILQSRYDPLQSGAVVYYRWDGAAIEMLAI